MREADMFLILIATFAIVLLLLPPTIGFAWRVGAVDVPKDWRRMHKKSVPRAGGLAMWIGFLLGCALFGVGNLFGGYLIGCGCVVFLAGMIDDIVPLSPWIKFFVQTVAAAVLAVKGMGVVGFAAVEAVFWILLLTNAHNFIDGLDGLFCGCAAIEAGAVGVLLWTVGAFASAQAALLLMSCCLAFRVFNRHPAILFAGDSGSGSVGFLLGALSFRLLAFSGVRETLSTVLVFAYPITDLTAAVLRRVLRGKSPFSADRGHLHHRICDAGVDQVTCVRLLLLLTFGLCGLAVMIGAFSLYSAASAGCVIMALVLMAMRRRIVGKY